MVYGNDFVMFDTQTAADLHTLYSMIKYLEKKIQESESKVERFAMKRLIGACKRKAKRIAK